MNSNGQQGELFMVCWQPQRHPFRLHVNDLIRWEGNLGRVIRVTDCAAVLLVNRPPREFTTRFDKRVRFRQPPIIVRIAANSGIAILYRKVCKGSKRKRHDQASKREEAR